MIYSDKTFWEIQVNTPENICGHFELRSIISTSIHIPRMNTLIALLIIFEISLTSRANEYPTSSIYSNYQNVLQLGYHEANKAAISLFE